MNKTHLNIIYEDEWLIAINKPAGMLVHPGKDPEPDESIALKSVRNYLEQYVYIVHRLDRPTSGVLIFARDKETQSKLSILFQTREVKKNYLAVVVGSARKSDSIDLPLSRSEETKTAPSFTEYKCLNIIPAGNFGEESFSLLDVVPHTGRYHQIRRHLFSKGLPIMGDYLYGNIEQNDINAVSTGVKRMMLMSKSLEFIHPQTHQKLFIEAQITEEFKKFS